MAHSGDGGPLWVEPMKAALESFLMDTVSLREKTPHVIRSPSAETMSANE
jgi:hypothetical protein